MRFIISTGVGSTLVDPVDNSQTFCRLCSEIDHND